MISYVFWHSPRAGVTLDAYESAHRGFLGALSDARPAGLRRSMAFRIEPVPWVSPETQAYEDWYVLDASAALDVLNDAAVTGAAGEAHYRVAPMSATGTAGLYRLWLGAPGSAPLVWAHWFSKPAGMSYRELTDSLAGLCSGPGVCLWVRQMVLGPAPELCLQASAPVQAPYPGLTVERTALFDRSA